MATVSPRRVFLHSVALRGYLKSRPLGAVYSTATRPLLISALADRQWAGLSHFHRGGFGTSFAREIRLDYSTKRTSDSQDRKNGQNDARTMTDVPPMAHSIISELKIVRDAFTLKTVPLEPYILGLASTLPYFATSIFTVFLGWSLQGGHGPNSLAVGHAMAQQWLQTLEPIQMGYGAVIISFLGAIHWGIEFGERVPSADRSKFRYGIGLLAPVIAWPTLLLPVQFGLIGQFLAFTLLYFADTRAAARGWVPAWYGPYRFLLTTVVCSAILVSLVFRAKSEGSGGTDMPGRLEEGMHQRGIPEQPYDERWAKMEHREVEERKKEEKKAEREQKRVEKKQDVGEKKQVRDKEAQVEEEKQTGEGKKEETEGKRPSD